MDLSQQELPLTAYFTRVSKDTRPRSKGKPTESESSQSVACPSKRRRTNRERDTASPFAEAPSQSERRPTTLQLPTPATSTRKRGCSGHPEGLIRKAQPTPCEQNANLSSRRNFAQLKFRPTPSKSPQSLREGAEDLVAGSLGVSPTTDSQAITDAIVIGLSPGPRLSKHADTGITTPQTSRRTSQRAWDIDDQFPLTRSMCQSGPPRLRRPGLPQAVSPHAHAHSITGPSYSSVDLGCSDPFDTYKRGCVSGSRGCAPAPPKRCRTETLDDQFFNDHVAPMIPIQSSQSQYLLHPDATPKRKRGFQPVENVMSSQTQEERELTLPEPYKLATMLSSPAGVSPGKGSTHRNVQTPHFSRERVSHHLRAPGSVTVESLANCFAGPAHSLLATGNVTKRPLTTSPSPSRREKFSSCKITTLQTSRHKSIGNIPPEYIDDSLTESESESDILQVSMQNESSLLDSPLQEMDQVSRHLLVSRKPCSPVRCGPAQGGHVEDDSATEAESDTEILRCVAEIGRQRLRQHRSETPREDAPPPIISPLVTPTRPRIVTVSSTAVSTRSLTQEGATLDVLGASHPSNADQPETHSESLPLVVRNFVRMFSGDESYPADFPESLRI